MKYCKKCNKKFADVNAFCSICGAKLITPDMTKETPKFNSYVNKLFKNLDNEIFARMTREKTIYYSSYDHPSNINQIIFDNFISNKVPPFIKCESTFGADHDNNANITIFIYSIDLFKGLLNIEIAIDGTPNNIKAAKQYDFNNSFKGFYNRYNEIIDTHIKIIDKKIVKCNEAIKNWNEIKNMIEREAN